MDIVELNLALVDRLQRFDPFQLGRESYDTEIADIIQEVHQLDDSVPLGERMQAIYAFSFERTIPLEKCILVATELLDLKERASCQ